MAHLDRIVRETTISFNIELERFCFFFCYLDILSKRQIKHRSPLSRVPIDSEEIRTIGNELVVYFECRISDCIFVCCSIDPWEWECEIEQ